MGRAIAAIACLDDLDVAGRLAARGPEHLVRLLLGHGARRAPRPTLRQVDKLGDVPADEVELLRSADRPGEHALDLDERCLAQVASQVLKEPIAVGGLEVLQLRGADLRIDPLLGLATVDGYGVRIEREIIQPISDALPDCLRNEQAWLQDGDPDVYAEIARGSPCCDGCGPGGRGRWLYPDGRARIRRGIAELVGDQRAAAVVLGKPAACPAAAEADHGDHHRAGLLLRVRPLLRRAGAG
jgi:hypothetical protein